MIIIHGTRHFERERGRIAEFCPVCGQITAFRLVELCTQAHVYFLPITRGEIQGYIAKCTECACQLETDPAVYQAVVKSKEVGLADLISKTFPDIHQVRARELALSKQIAIAPQRIPRPEREELLLQRFTALAGAVQRDAFKNPRALLFTVLTLLVMFVGPGIARWLGKPIPERFVLWFIGGECMCWLGLALWWASQPRRFLRGKVIPQLVRAIAPLSPGYDELQYCLDSLDVAGWKIGRKLSADMLWKLLEKP